MILWKNTDILNGYLDDLRFTDVKQNAEIAVLGSKTVSLDDFPSLKGIFRVGVGLDNVPVNEARKRGIKVQITSNNTNEYIYDETASFTCYLILRMLYWDSGSIEPWSIKIRRPLKDTNLLILGTGNIGKRVADKMRQFMRIITFDVMTNNMNDLKDSISCADCISLHIPLTRENTNFFDREKLSWMKDKAVLINTSRGAIVLETALYEEIKNGRLLAAFDVFWNKPYTGKLKEFYPDRFYMTPHVASKCDAFLSSASEDLRLFIKEVEND